jgi:hypothetical protein
MAFFRTRILFSPLAGSLASSDDMPNSGNGPAARRRSPRDSQVNPPLQPGNANRLPQVVDVGAKKALVAFHKSVVYEFLHISEHMQGFMASDRGKLFRTIQLADTLKNNRRPTIEAVEREGSMIFNSRQKILTKWSKLLLVNDGLELLDSLIPGKRPFPLQVERRLFACLDEFGHF